MPIRSIRVVALPILAVGIGIAAAFAVAYAALSEIAGGGREPSDR